MIGLVSAANDYGPAHWAFEPYAYLRVRGAIIDSQKRRGVPREAERVARGHCGAAGGMDAALAGDRPGAAGRCNC
jgi:DNA-directed RNA polymerase specialized sigma subunit